MKKDMTSRGSQDHLCGAGSQANHAGQLTPASPVGAHHELLGILADIISDAPKYYAEAWERVAQPCKACGGSGLDERPITSADIVRAMLVDMGARTNWEPPGGDCHHCNGTGRWASDSDASREAARAMLEGYPWMVAALTPGSAGDAEPLTNAAPSGAHAAQVPGDRSREAPSPTGTK